MREAASVNPKYRLLAQIRTSCLNLLLLVLNESRNNNNLLITCECGWRECKTLGLLGVPKDFNGLVELASDM